MSVKMFIPSVWSAAVMRQLEKMLVYGQAGVINRNFQGEITNSGDRVKINSIGPVTVSTYTTNTNMGTPEELTGAEQWLIIDQSKYFNFQVDDVDTTQANANLRDSAMMEAGYALADTADQYLAAQMAANIATANTIGSTASPKTDLGTAGKAYDYLIDLGTALSDANVPREGRWTILPPWYIGLLVKHGQTFQRDTALGDAAVLNGFVGRAAGFNIFESQNVPNTSAAKYKVIGGHGMATTFAEQIAKVEAFRMELRFADGIKGLHVYGAKITRPTALAMLICNKPS